MKWIKKVAETPLDTDAKVVNSIELASSKNAPSVNAVKEALAQVWDSIYPIGSIYLSVSEKNPAILFGGTWVKIEDRVLLGAGTNYTNGEQGGEAEVTLEVNNLPSHSHDYTHATAVQDHALTDAEMPRHTHLYQKALMALDSYEKAAVSAASTGVFNAAVYEEGNKFTYPNYSGLGEAHNHGLTTESASTQSVGTNTPINNMPPYLTVNIWKRIA